MKYFQCSDKINFSHSHIFRMFFLLFVVAISNQIKSHSNCALFAHSVNFAAAVWLLLLGEILVAISEWIFSVLNECDQNCIEFIMFQSAPPNQNVNQIHLAAHKTWTPSTPSHNLIKNKFE